MDKTKAAGCEAKKRPRSRDEPEHAVRQQPDIDSKQVALIEYGSLMLCTNAIHTQMLKSEHGESSHVHVQQFSHNQ